MPMTREQAVAEIESYVRRGGPQSWAGSMSFVACLSAAHAHGVDVRQLLPAHLHAHYLDRLGMGRPIDHERDRREEESRMRRLAGAE